MGFFMDQSA